MDFIAKDHKKILMYKRRLKSKQENIQKQDDQFQSIRFLSKGKKLAPTLTIITMLIVIISIIMVKEKNSFSYLFSSLAILVVIINMSFLFDRIEFYEYGMIKYTVFGFIKKRIAYDEVISIKEKKYRKNDENNHVLLWQIQTSSQQVIIIDATSYIGISQMLITLRYETQIPK